MNQLIIKKLKKEDFPAFRKRYRAQEKSFANSWPFLQSDQWAELEEGASFYYFGEGGEPDGFFLALESKVGKKYSYAYLPRGPFFFSKKKSEEKDFLENLLKALRSWGKERGYFFIRLEPLSWDLGKVKLGRASRDVQPAKTTYLDLSLGAEELLARMHQKTRYNIRLAEKRGVEIKRILPKEDNFSEKFETFWTLIKTTAERDRFSLHSKEHYHQMIKGDFIRFYEASFQTEVLAMGLFSFFDNTVTYLHGASSNQQRQLMAPYLLQWHLIKEAIEEGFFFYDFYGIDEKKWPGVTRFKKGFRGEEFSYLGTRDLPLKKNLYLLYNISGRIIALKRRLKFF